MEKIKNPLGREIANFAINIGAPRETHPKYAAKYNRAHDKCVDEIIKIFKKRIQSSLK